MPCPPPKYLLPCYLPSSRTAADPAFFLSSILLSVQYFTEVLAVPTEDKNGTDLPLRSDRDPVTSPEGS